jgi:endonuclease/exonuclease/phosphatase family metal-dependent hydrolase
MYCFFSPLRRTGYLVFLISALLLAPFSHAAVKKPINGFEVSAPQTLTARELNQLLDHPDSPELQKKVTALLNTPFLYKHPALNAGHPTPLASPKLGPTLRVASWNIERGFELPSIIEIFTKPAPGKPQADLIEQARWLSQSQVILLTEADQGMNRTQYQNTVFQLASSLHMNAAYGVEFLELGPLYLRKKMLALPENERKTIASTEYDLDEQKYLGLHGSAILSRYPILDVQLIRLPDGYDWYHGELAKLSALEKIKRKAADTIFLENVLTEVRWGGRIALAVDLKIPELPEGKATFVVTHLENRAKPEARQMQMAYLLNALKNRRNPIVIGGDWNTTGSDVSPTSVRKELRNHLTDPAFWSKNAISLLSPYGLFINLGLRTTQFTKNLYDPTAVDIPLLAPNHEKGLFSLLQDFQFEDGTCFDMRGDKENTFNKTRGLLANSNQRWLKGFVPTFSFERPIAKGVIGRYKLDWFIVKDYVRDPLESNQPYLFAPHYGRTLTGINKLFPVKISDHDPITIDLPLQEPRKGDSGNSL